MYGLSFLSDFEKSGAFGGDEDTSGVDGSDDAVVDKEDEEVKS